MKFTDLALPLFQEAIKEYHVKDDPDSVVVNPYPDQTIEYCLYLKCRIDTVQWHLEDLVRDPDIDPSLALKIKRRIDRSNQERTDLVEMIDSYFLEQFRDIPTRDGARTNTESPAWAVDRLSILELKIYQMQVEVDRKDVDPAHREACAKKLQVLFEQRKDLSTAIDQLIEEIQAGTKYMKVYKQMKMYNDPSLNPILYSNKN